MNSDRMKDFLTGVGLMTEIWMVTYNGFKKQGLTDQDALAHTKAFMTMAMESMLNGVQEDDK